MPPCCPMLAGVVLVDAGSFQPTLPAARAGAFRLSGAATAALGRQVCTSRCSFQPMGRSVFRAAARLQVPVLLILPAGSKAWEVAAVARLSSTWKWCTLLLGGIVVHAVAANFALPAALEMEARRQSGSRLKMCRVNFGKLVASVLDLREPPLPHRHPAAMYGIWDG